MGILSEVKEVQENDVMIEDSTHMESEKKTTVEEPIEEKEKDFFNKEILDKSKVSIKMEVEEKTTREQVEEKGKVITVIVQQEEPDENLAKVSDGHALFSNEQAVNKEKSVFEGEKLVEDNKDTDKVLMELEAEKKICNDQIEEKQKDNFKEETVETEKKADVQNTKSNEDINDEIDEPTLNKKDKKIDN